MGNVERAVRDNNQTATTGRVMTRSASDVGGNLSHRGVLMRGRRFTGITASLRGVAGHNSTLMAPASRQRQSGCTHMRVLGSPPGDVQERRCSQAQVNDSKRRAHAASTRSAQPQSTLAVLLLAASWPAATRRPASTRQRRLTRSCQKIQLAIAGTHAGIGHVCADGAARHCKNDASCSRFRSAAGYMSRRGPLVQQPQRRLHDWNPRGSSSYAGTQTHGGRQ